MNTKYLTREERGKQIAQNTRIVRTKRGWIVPSQTSGQQYTVSFKDEPECTCPDCQIRKHKCKHIYAVEFYLKKEIDQQGKLSITKGIKISYPQYWRAYNQAQTNEKTLFMKLLSDLCQNIESPNYQFGRPRIPLQDMIFSSVMKIYTTFSLRRFMSDIKIAKKEQLIDYVPCFASVGHFLQKEEVTPILKKLITLSSLPLKSIETDFAIDSSGFSTSRFARWYNFKWKKEKKYRIWLKAHLISGVKTNIVTGCKITEGHSSDCPELPELIQQTAKNFNMQEVSADKAYSSRANLEAIQSIGATPYIPFKKNVTGKSRGSYIWMKMYHYFLYKHEEFLNSYHKRSNSETVFHMIKTKFKDNLRSKTKTAQINELLCKILCHNICVIIQEIHELGITPEFN